MSGGIFTLLTDTTYSYFVFQRLDISNLGHASVTMVSMAQVLWQPSSSPGESLGAFVFDLKARSRFLLYVSWNVGVKPFNKKMTSRYEFQTWSKLGICWLVDDIHFERMYEKTNSKIANLKREMGLLAAYLIWDE